ncbi:hypothetical protein G3M54_22075 [Bacillus megaterium NBRC 15308 = ATCC 14581]|nr:hypothetical protein [Priestia megaterium NBRC 15308 = ATCC 14581]
MGSLEGSFSCIKRNKSRVEQIKTLRKFAGNKRQFN